MSETRFTPGPWKKGKGYMAIISDHPTGFDDEASLSAYGGHLVCESVKMDANAHLIAAAPDLYSVLSEAMSRGGLIQMCLYEKALAAIAKARGEV